MIKMWVMTGLFEFPSFKQRHHCYSKSSRIDFRLTSEENLRSDQFADEPQKNHNRYINRGNHSPQKLHISFFSKLSLKCLNSSFLHDAQACVPQGKDHTHCRCMSSCLNPWHSSGPTYSRPEPAPRATGSTDPFSEHMKHIEPSSWNGKYFSRPNGQNPRVLGPSWSCLPPTQTRKLVTPLLVVPLRKLNVSGPTQIFLTFSFHKISTQWLGLPPHHGPHHPMVDKTQNSNPRPHRCPPPPPPVPVGPPASPPGAPQRQALHVAPDVDRLQGRRGTLPSLSLGASPPPSFSSNSPPWGQKNNFDSLHCAQIIFGVSLCRIFSLSPPVGVDENSCFGGSLPPDKCLLK